MLEGGKFDLYLRRASGTKVYRKESIVIEGIENLEDSKKKELRMDEEIDRMGCERGTLEMTSRTGITFFNCFFSVKKINEENNSKKEKKE